MIRFYPRDVGVWRERFQFNVNDDPYMSIKNISHIKNLNRPYRDFENISQIKDLCREVGLNVDDATYPFTIRDHYVIVWTVVGYIEMLPPPSIFSRLKKFLYNLL